MTLYLFRHAAVEETYRGCYNGHRDIPASKEGLIEAKENFKAIKAVEFDAVYCSTLQRAKATLKALDIKQEVIYSDILREKSWGRHEGKSYDEIVEMEGVSYENFAQWLDVLDGEDYQVFIENIRLYLLALSEKPYKKIFIMTHAGIIYSIIHLLDKISLEASFAIKISYGSFLKIELNSSKQL